MHAFYVPLVKLNFVIESVGVVVFIAPLLLAFCYFHNRIPQFIYWITMQLSLLMIVLIAPFSLDLVKEGKTKLIDFVPYI